MSFTRRVLTKFKVFMSGATLPLHRATRNGDLSQVRELLAARVDIDARDGHGNTPLHVASFHGYTGIVKELISAGASVDIKSAAGFTPIYWASTHGHSEAVEVLVSAGAEMHATDGQGETPPNATAGHEHGELVQEPGSASTSIGASDDGGSKASSSRVSGDEKTPMFKFKERRRDWIIGAILTVIGFSVVSLVLMSTELGAPSPEEQAHKLARDWGVKKVKMDQGMHYKRLQFVAYTTPKKQPVKVDLSVHNTAESNVFVVFVGLSCPVDLVVTLVDHTATYDYCRDESILVDSTAGTVDRISQRQANEMSLEKVR